MCSVSAMDISGLDVLKEILGKCQRTTLPCHGKAGFIEKIGADNFCANIDIALMRAASLEK
ncbi:hypothetical protein HMPREF9682_01213 [Streptococcus intermedius F0395]|nr:hypothetical protein HMPREF9682_01213 [Streptococcus intermedius F0395]